MVMPLLRREERYRYVNDLLLLDNRAFFCVLVMVEGLRKFLRQRHPFCISLG